MSPSETLAPLSQRLRRFVVVLTGVLVLLANADAAELVKVTAAVSPIRSAQLFSRDGAWESVEARSPEVERAEIRAHFASVRSLLIRSEPTSLAIAAARFEQAFGVSLTPGERMKLLDALSVRREIQLQRLADYARASRFPLNRHYAGEARPIFVDARGTHCAVGHLMALDGWETGVIAIARATPNVLVREVTDGPLVSWLLTSGLIQEEAALIQPGYYPPLPGDATSLGALVVPGTSLDRDGFRYENFSFSASSTGGATTPIATRLGLVYGWPPLQTVPNIFCASYGPGCVPRPDTFWIGVFQSPTSIGSLTTLANQSIDMVIDYDVVALTPDLAIGGASIYSSSLYNGFNFGLMFKTEITSDSSAPLELEFALSFPYGPNYGAANALFDTPAGRVHVQHNIQMVNEANFTSFDAGILHPVPLPGSAALLGFALAALGRCFRRSKVAKTGVA